MRATSLTIAPIFPQAGEGGDGGRRADRAAIAARAGAVVHGWASAVLAVAGGRKNNRSRRIEKSEAPRLNIRNSSTPLFGVHSGNTARQTSMRKAQAKAPIPTSANHGVP